MFFNTYWKKGGVVGLVISLIFIASSEIQFWLSNPESLSVSWHYAFGMIIYSIIIIDSILVFMLLGSIVDAFLTKKLKPLVILISIIVVLNLLALIPYFQVQNTLEKNIEKKAQFNDQYLVAKELCENSGEPYVVNLCFDRNDKLIENITKLQDDKSMTVFKSNCARKTFEFIDPLNECILNNGYSEIYTGAIRENCERLEDCYS